MMKIKVGMMPGKLVEIVTNEGATAREIFNIAGVELSNHEIRLDGEKIDLDKTINNGNLLVAMKMIKGNMPSIKVGMMPGKLEVVEYTEGDTANDIFEKANIGLSNHEIRLDGEKIALDTRINNGNLLVAMKMIKGNANVYVTECTEDEIELLLDVKLPTKINESDVSKLGWADGLLEIIIDGEEIVVEEDMFLSVYNEIVDEFNGEEVGDIREVREEIVDTRKVQLQDNKAMEVLSKELEELEKSYSFYIEEAHTINNKIMFLQRIISEINA